MALLAKVSCMFFFSFLVGTTFIQMPIYEFLGRFEKEVNQLQAESTRNHIGDCLTIMDEIFFFFSANAVFK